MLKKNNGITLIALVITIIVLLILAGVSIAMLTGDNGVLSRASSAKVANKLGEVKDEISLLASEQMTDYYQETYVNATANSGVKYDTGALDTKIINAIKTKAGINASTTKGTLNSVSVEIVGNKGFKLTYQGYEVSGSTADGKITWQEIKKTPAAAGEGA